MVSETSTADKAKRKPRVHKKKERKNLAPEMHPHILRMSQQPFSDIVRKIIKERSDLRLGKNVAALIQTRVENDMSKNMAKANIIATLSKRHTVTERDIVAAFIIENETELAPNKFFD